MEKIYPHLELREHLPSIAACGMDQPIRWLKSGWQDLKHNAAASLAYGAILTAAGWVTLVLTSGHPHLFAAAICGYLLVGPLCAAGLYELSRRRAAGQSTSFDDSLEGLKRRRGALAEFGLVLAIFVIVWERLSALLFGAFFGGSLPELTDIMYRSFFTWDYPGFVMTYASSGAVLAVIVFAISAVSVPMIMDRPVDIVTAMLTSVKAVGINFPAMMVWAGLIVALSAIGFATLLLGMILVIPWLGHATWHAYKELVGES